MAVTYLGRLDQEEELLHGTERSFYGCDAAADVSSLPTTAGFEFSGGKTPKPAPWSLAKVAATGAVYYFNGTTWSEVG